ncbi:mCG147268 [Mus musculus]|nr:mCG147268 [Mus musculus]
MMVSGSGNCIGMNSQMGQSLGGLPFSLCSILYLHIYSCECFVFLLRRMGAPTLWCSFFLSFMWSVKCILRIWSFWANIHLSVSGYHVCSFCDWVTALRMIFSSSIHLPKNFMNSSFLIAE